MANELDLYASVAYDDGLVADSIGISHRDGTSTGKRKTHLVQNVGFAAAEAVQLGELTSVGTLVLKNLDPTNSINVLVSAAGAQFAVLEPDALGDGTGGFCVIAKMGSGAQVPYVQALVAQCRLEVFVVEV